MICPLYTINISIRISSGYYRLDYCILFAQVPVMFYRPEIFGFFRKKNVDHWRHSTIKCRDRVVQRPTPDLPHFGEQEQQMVNMPSLAVTYIMSNIGAMGEDMQL